MEKEKETDGAVTTIVDEGALAGMLMRHWMPVGITRRVLFLLIILLTVVELIENPQWYHLIFIIFALSMSPRAIGTAAFYAGKLYSFLRKK